MQRPHQRLRVRKIGSVVRDQKQIDCTDEIVGTGKFEFFLFGQISKIQKTEMAIGDQHADRSSILSVIGGSGRLGRTVGVGFARSRATDL